MTAVRQSRQSIDNAMAARGVLWCAALLCAASGAAGGAAGGAASGAASGAGPACARDQPCAALGSSLDEHFFKIRDIPLTITYSEGRSFSLACRNVTLEDPALPALPRLALVARVRLVACAPPPRGYARALRALNLSLADAALELSALPDAPPLRAAHLAALRLAALAVEQPRCRAAAPCPAPLPLESALLGALPALRELRLRGVALSAGASLLLPPELRALLLERVAGAALDAAALARLPALRRLVVRDDALRELDLSAATALRNVTVDAPLRGLTLGARVEALTLQRTESAELRGACAALRYVTLVNVTWPLPARWLARCGGVRELRAFGSRGALGGAELEGASALRVLEARACGLRELPPRWLADAVLLRALDLSRNLLERLPSLAACPALQELRAQHNRLDAAALAPLGALSQLRVLVLDDNRALRDLCGGTDKYLVNALSPLAELRSLRALSVRRSGVAALCLDWRLQLPALAALDLRDNNITSLTFEDLQWRRDAPSVVDLRGNDVYVDYKEADYRTALRLRPDPHAPLTTLLLDNVVQCDCNDYWFARAWRERPGHARVALSRLRCRPAADAAADATAAAGPAPDLLDMPLDELLCDMTKDCPRGCRCRVSPDGTELACRGGGVTRVPAPGASVPPVRALRLRGAGVALLRAADVGAALRLLDATGAGLRALEPGAVAALWDAAPRALLLADNPLDCSCAALPLLRAVAAEPRRVRDLARARCADGRALAAAAAAAAAACGARALWPALLAALPLAAGSALAAACVARPATRHRIKRFLFERGLCLRWTLRGARCEADAADAADAAREFDAFVSYAHEDQRYADELLRRLERGAARRLCLHSRDWLPGDWIPAQIARSVRAARRTLVLLSERFLRSAWARAELREAYAAALLERRPRLLLLLLPGCSAAAAAAADPALRAYLARVTYLRWDDPHFWRKLETALPPARAPSAPRAPPAPRAPSAPPPPP